jgi:hypothetical protein
MKLLNDRSARELTFVGFFILLGFAIYLSYQAGKREVKQNCHQVDFEKTQ